MSAVSTQYNKVQYNIVSLVAWQEQMWVRWNHKDASCQLSVMSRVVWREYFEEYWPCYQETTLNSLDGMDRIWESKSQMIISYNGSPNDGWQGEIHHRNSRLSPLGQTQVCLAKHINK